MGAVTAVGAGGGPSTAAPAPAATAAAAAEAQAHYDRAIEAQRAGDWAKYGEEIKALGDALARLRNR